MADQRLMEDADAQYEILNQFLVHQKEPSNAAQVTFSNYDAVLIEPSLSMTKKSGSEPTKNIPNVSMAKTSYHAQSRPHLFETCRQISPRPDSPELPTLSGRGQTVILRSYDLPDSPPAINIRPLPYINLMVQE